MKDIQQAVGRLNADELRSCLKLALHHIALLKEQAALPGRAIAGLIGLHDTLVNRDDAAPFRDPAPGCTRVHVVTGGSFAGGMKLALRELGLADTHSIITINDNFAIGPIRRLDTPEGRRARSDWFRHNIASAALGEDDDPEAAHQALLQRMNRIPAQAEIIVWTSRSVYEQTGMRYALHLLRNRPNPVRICDACAICEELDGVTCRRSGEIGPDRLREAIKRTDNSPILSASDIRRLADEWISVAEQGGVLRIREDDAVREVPADHFDPYLLETLDRAASAADADGFVKAARVVGEAVGYGDQDIGDEYFEYRLRELIYAGVLEIRGVPAGLRYYSVRRKRRAQPAPA